MSDAESDGTLTALMAALELSPGPCVLLRALRDDRGIVSDFKIVDVNQSACESWGQARASLKDHRLGEVLPPEVAAAGQSALSRIVQSGAGVEEVVLDLADETWPSPFFDHFRAIGLGDMALVALDLNTPDRRALELYRTLLESSADVVVKVDQHGLIDWFLDTTGVLEYESAELIGTKIDNLLSPDSVLARARHRENLAAARVERFSVEMRSRSGGLHTFSAVGCRQFDVRGGITGVIVGLHLSDESVARERVAQEVEEHYQFLASFARDVVAVERGDVVDWVSPNVAQLIGLDDRAVVGRPLVELVHPDDQGSLLALRHDANGEDTTSLTVRMGTAEGDFRWVNLVVRDLEESLTGSWVRLSSWRDAQGDVAARQALLASERRYRLLAENSTDVVVECDANAVVRWLSPSALASMGWRGDDTVGRSLIDLVVESERAEVVHQLERAEAFHQVAPLEVRYLDAEGRSKWMSQQIRRFRGHEDRRFVYIVTLHDIDDLVTLRRQAIAAANETRLLKEHSSDLIYTTDLEGNVNWVSPSVTTLLGWQTAEVLGSDVVQLMFEDDRPRVLAWRQLIHYGETVEDLEIRVQHANGYFVWMKVRAEPLRDDDGRLIGVVASGRNCDIEVASTRALRTISASSRVLMRERSPREMLRQVCQVAVDEGGYAFAWFGRKFNDDDKSVTVVASSRDHQSYLAGIEITWGQGEGGQGPTGRAIRLGQSVTLGDAYTEESFRPWHDRARAHGFHSACAIPVVVNGQIEGTWQVYARERGAFTPSVMSVLEDLALDTGLAMSRLDLSDL